MKTGRYLAICVVLLAWAGLAGGATLRVPADYSMIQAAIDAADSGDEIEVAPGTYDGPGDTTESSALIDFKGKAVRLYSQDGLDVTTIDGSRYQHVVRCISGEGRDTVLEGFTITHGGWGEYPSGGGMYNENSSPTVTNCLFTLNHAYYLGGGMYNYCSSPMVTNCTFTNNITYMSGCGMANDAGSPVVINCIFTDSSTSYYGGGMSNNSGSSPTVINCVFSGGGASYEGSAMYNRDSSPIVTHCTIVNNTIGASDVGGGGAMYNENSSPTVTNCIFWNNSRGQITGDPGTVNNCDIEGGWLGTGNIGVCPRFVGDGDYHLLPDSPCIDAGTNNPPGGLPDTDLEGNPRSADGNGDGESVADMGAYEAPAVDAGQLLTDLIRDVRALNLARPVRTSLEANLIVARKILADDKTCNDAAAIHSLRAFINEVKACRGKKISRADADALIAAARQIIGLLRGR